MIPYELFSAIIELVRVGLPDPFAKYTAGA
jgi:hypothetical protein